MSIELGTTVLRGVATWDECSTAQYIKLFGIHAFRCMGVVLVECMLMASCSRAAWLEIDLDLIPLGEFHPRHDSQQQRYGCAMLESETRILLSQDRCF